MLNVSKGEIKKYFWDDGEEKRKMVARILWSSDSYVKVDEGPNFGSHALKGPRVSTSDST